MNVENKSLAEAVSELLLMNEHVEIRFSDIDVGAKSAFNGVIQMIPSCTSTACVSNLDGFGHVATMLAELIKKPELAVYRQDKEQGDAEKASKKGWVSWVVAGLDDISTAETLH